jgi:DNA-binding SARP family transcriptional activator
MMNQLSLRFLGNPEVYDGEQRLKLPTRKALALLIYLVVEGGSHKREKLVVLFWPDSEAGLGFAALRNTLARLRTTLRQVGPLLLDQEGALGFDFNMSFTLDLHSIGAAVRVIKAGQPDVTLLQAAVTAYRADFLEGFSLPDAPAFDDWASFQREHWHYQMDLVFEALSDLQAERRDFEAGVTTTLRWIAHHPLNEAAHRRLMQLYFMKGDRSTALQAFATCQTVLQAELGLEPSAETKALAERIKKDEGGRMKDEGKIASSSPAPVRGLIPHPSSFQDLPFAGRAAEHAELAARYQTVRQGQSHVVVIQGEAGVGKTRLATEFLNWLVVQAADVLQGRAFEAGGRLPYQPIVEAMRQRLDQENAPDDLLSDVWLAELSRLLPELRDRYPDLPPPVADEGLARTRLPEAVARLGQALAARHPIVLFLDDVQWADVASLDLLHYLARSWTERRTAVLLLFTLRTEALLADPSLETWLSGLARDAALTRFSLESLTSEETEQLARQLAGERNHDPSSAAAFAHWLFRETAGQPLFIVESLKALLEQGFLQLQTDVMGQRRVDLTELIGLEEDQATSLRGLIPPGVRQVILNRLKRLTPPAVALLTAAAVLGRDCHFEQLCRVADQDEGQALPALDELLHSRLLLEMVGPYRFSHDKIRDVVYTEAGDARRRVYHRRAFEMMESMAVPAAELAYHALAARLVEPAFRYSVATGDAAMALFAIRDAINYYEQARQLVSDEWRVAGTGLQKGNLIPGPRPPAPGLQLHHLYAQLSRAYELWGDYEQAEAICQEMRTQAETASQPAMACAALNRLASLAIYSQQMAKANGLLAEAKQIAEASGDKASLAQTEWSLGQLTHHSDDFVASRRHSEQALTLAHELDDPALIAGSSNTLAYALFFLGQIEAAAEVMEAARAGYAALGNRALEADSLVGLAATRFLNGEIEASIAAARSAYEMGREIENAFGQAMSQPWLICGLVDRGDYGEALAIARRNLTATNSQELAPKLLAAFSAGFVYWALGDVETAWSVHQELNPLLVEANVPGYLEQNAAHLCVDAALAGDWQTAHIFARQALSLRDYHALPLLLTLHWPETEALLRGGDIELAHEDTRRWGELVGHIPRYRPLYLRSLALLSQWQGNIDEAITHLEEAHTLAEAIGLLGEQGQILAKLGELYQAQQNEDKAQPALRKAREIMQILLAPTFVRLS